MKQMLLLLLSFCLCVACAGVTGTAANPPATAPAGPASADDLLDALDRTGKAMNDFQADVRFVDSDNLANDTTRTGHVWFQKQSAGQERLRVLLDKRLTHDGKASVAEPIEYLLRDGWLTDRDYNKRIEVRRQVLRPGQKANLLKLGEGPFPLPIGQDKEDVRKLFTVSLVRPFPSDDPPGTGHLVLKPVKGTPYERKFASIDIWVDPRVGMPARIDTTRGDRTTSTILSAVKINPGLKDSDFELAPIKVQNWNVHEEPFQN